MSDLVVVSAFSFRDDPGLPAAFGRGGGWVCGLWFLQIVFAQGLRPCRGGSGPVSGALRVSGLVGVCPAVRVMSRTFGD